MHAAVGYAMGRCVSPLMHLPVRVPASGAARVQHRTLSQLLPFATLFAFLAFLSVSFLAVTGLGSSAEFGALRGFELAVTWMIGASLVGRGHAAS